MVYAKTYIIGDIHGHWNRLADILENLEEGSSVILVGDLALGFPNMTLSKFSQVLEPNLNKNDLTLYAIRGNHDCLNIWGEKSSCSSIILVKDFSELTINGKNYYFVGGATSIDRPYRRSGVDYWPDEVIDYAKYVPPKKKIDVLITHSAPDFCYPIGFNDFCRAWFKYDKNMESELTAERVFLSKICDEIKPKQHFYGHFHRSVGGHRNGCQHTLLDELEIKEII